MKHVSIAVAALAAGVAAVALTAPASAGDSSQTCAEQAAERSAVVTPARTATTTATATATATASPASRGARGDASQPDAVASQLTADGSGRPQPVDPEGEPIAGAAQLLYAFGTGRDPITRRQAFLLPEGMKADELTVTLPFQDVIDDDGRPLSPAHLQAVIGPAGPGRLVTVAFCVNPSFPAEMGGGSYTGTALVGVDEHVTAVTLEATVQDDRWALVVIFALLGLTSGLFIRLTADKQTTEHITSLWAVSPTRIITTIGAGLVVAFYSFRTIYLDDTTFEANLVDLFRLSAEVFAGTLAAKTLADLSGQQKRPKPEVIPEAQKPPPAPA